MGITDGTVVHWLKSVGDQVTEGDALVEVETAKVTSVIEAPTSGVLKEIFAPEGATVAVQEALARIEDAQA